MTTALGTSLGTSLGTVLGTGAGNIRAQFAALFVSGQDAWFDADNYTESGGRVTAFVDYNDPAHLLAQATFANQVPTPTVDATAGGAKTATFVAGNFNKYDSNRALSAQRHRHDGTGGELFIVYVPTVSATFGITGTCSGSGIGFRIATTAANYVNQVIGNGAAGIVGVAGGGAIVVDAVTYQSISYSNAASPKYAVYGKSTLAGSGTPSPDSPSALDPQASLRVGGNVDDAFYASMRWRAVFDFKRVLTASQRAVVRAYIQATTGAV